VPGGGAKTPRPEGTPEKLRGKGIQRPLRDAPDFDCVCQPLGGWLISGGLPGRENDPYRAIYIFEPNRQTNSLTEEFCPAFPQPESKYYFPRQANLSERSRI
jgi:hypothetical protein